MNKCKTELKMLRKTQVNFFDKGCLDCNHETYLQLSSFLIGKERQMKTLKCSKCGHEYTIFQLIKERSAAGSAAGGFLAFLAGPTAFAIYLADPTKSVSLAVLIPIAISYFGISCAGGSLLGSGTVFFDKQCPRCVRRELR